MRLSDIKPGTVSFLGAVLASCCLVPITLILLGLGSGAFLLSVTMRYRFIFFPLGALGVGLGYYLYFRELRRCRSLGCRMPWAGVNLAFLILSTLILAFATGLILFPELGAGILAG